MSTKYKFGKRIGRGGMAEVFLAMQEGLGGFEKLVVVKRIFRQFCSDQSFVQMFLEEARLAASIRHQNVVHVTDIGRDEQGFFIVMEYLSGESVAYLFETLRGRKQRVPHNIAARIAAEVAAGLHHAHTATDAGGEPQPIVHRDVTPSNLLVTFNGVVKIVDFGVAKATVGDGSTQIGALKGKMSYLAPEQIEERPVDGRTDVFQLGICLHEMLTGQRLFTGESDHQKMLAVVEKPIARPSSIDPAIPPELDRIVLWALERDPARRPATADALRRELEQYLGTVGGVSDHDLGEWMVTTLPERRKERLNMERASVADMRAGDQKSTAAPLPTSNFSDASVVVPNITRTRTPTVATVLHRKAYTRTSTRALHHGWIVASIVSLCMGAVVTGVWYVGRDQRAPIQASTQDGEPLVVRLGHAVAHLTNQATERMRELPPPVMPVATVAEEARPAVVSVEPIRPGFVLPNAVKTAPAPAPLAKAVKNRGKRRAVKATPAASVLSSAPKVEAAPEPARKKRTSLPVTDNINPWK